MKCGYIIEQIQEYWKNGLSIKLKGKIIDEIQFGIYACSPEDSSFKATFTNMEITECKWLAHDGQAPDED